jgi:hypothetical protein
MQRCDRAINHVYGMYKINEIKSYLDVTYLQRGRFQIKVCISNTAWLSSGYHSRFLVQKNIPPPPQTVYHE